MPDIFPGITPAQIKCIHALKTALAMDDVTYRAALSGCGVKTSKALTFSGAAELIDDFEKKAVKTGVWKKTPNRISSSQRMGFASPAQIALIEGVWNDISDAPEEFRKAALRKFVKRQAKVSDLRFLRDGDARKVICALRTMQRQKFGKERVGK